MRCASLLETVTDKPATAVQPAPARRDSYLLFAWLPKFDLVAIRILKPRKVPVLGIFRGLFNRHAFALQMAERFSHVLYAIIDLARSRLVLDVLVCGHDCPCHGSLGLRIINVPGIERCVDGLALAVVARNSNSEAIAIPGCQFLYIVGKQKNAANSINQAHIISPRS